VSETATPDLATVITAATAAALKGARVALPARVETYDATTQKVSVQPLIFEGFNDETGTRQSERLPVIADVPVVFPGAGGFRVTFPVAVGDTVLLVFASSSIDRWLALGGEVDPLDDRRHHISDAIAIPGLRDFAHPLAAAPTSTMSLGKDGGPTIEISASDIKAGGSQLLALLSDISSLITTFNSHTHLASGGATSVPSAPAAAATGTAVLKGG
jgi:Phage protein Gp138 N-terminal domain